MNLTEEQKAAIEAFLGDMTEHASFVTRIEPEPEHDKNGLNPAVDEIVTGPVDGIHLERLDDHIYWLGIYKGEERQVITFAPFKGRAKIVARTQRDT